MEEMMPRAGLVIRDDLQILAWEGDTCIEAFLSPSEAAYLGAKLMHLARQHKARAAAEEALRLKAENESRLRLSVRLEPGK